MEVSRRLKEQAFTVYISAILRIGRVSVSRRSIRPGPRPSARPGLPQASLLSTSLTHDYRDTVLRQSDLTSPGSYTPLLQARHGGRLSHGLRDPTISRMHPAPALLCAHDTCPVKPVY